MAIKTPKGYRVISGISKESLDAYIQTFTFGSGEKILVGRSNTLDLTITRGTRTSDGAGNALQIQGGQATGTNQVGGDVNIFTGYPTGNAASGDFQVFGAASKAASGSSVNPANATMFSISGDTGDATFANDITIGGNEITNTGSNKDLILTSDKDIYFSIDKDEDTTNNKFVFRKGGSSNPFVEIAELDESGNLQIDGSLTIGSTEVINSSAQVSASSIPTLNQDTTGNATTATALTSGDKTISGDLTVTSGTSGDATLIISADTDNNNEDDNARLWFKQDGDITEGAIQMSSNVLNIINNISAVGGISFQTGTTNNTGTTDPSTGATERMSIASSGTVTVAGALQPNTIELGHASDTTIARSAAGKVTIEGANVQTSQIVVTHHHFFMNSSSTTADFFFPYNNLNEASSTSQYFTRTIAPYDGKIIKVLIRPSAAIGTACKLQFHKITDTTLNFGTAVEEVTNVNLNTAETSVSTAFSSATFSAGDVVNVSLIKSSSSTANIQAVIVWEYTT